MSILFILLESISSYLYVIESIGLRGKLNLCTLQLLKHFLMLLSPNLHWQNSIERTARVVLKQGIPLAEVLFHPPIKARSFSQR